MINVKNREIAIKLDELEEKYFDFFDVEMPTLLMIDASKQLDEKEFKKLEKKVDDCISSLNPFLREKELNDINI